MTSNETASYDLTILVPVYNEEDNMQALSSRLAAYLPRAKMSSCVLFINDGSTDNTPAILREYAARDSRIRIIDKPNSGYGDSMNRALDAATGDYIGIVESDDIILPEMIYTALITLFTFKFFVFVNKALKRLEKANE